MVHMKSRILVGIFGSFCFQPSKFTSQIKDIKKSPELLLQGGPLLVINGVITPPLSIAFKKING